MMPPIVPRPVEYVPMQGAFQLAWDTEVVYTERLRNEAEYLARFLRPATGFPIPVRKGQVGDHNDILLRLAHEANGDGLGEEGYRLEVAPTGVLIEGTTPAGVFYGIQTWKQLLPVEALQRSGEARPWKVAAARIMDWPRFSWRGMHLDVSRHFFPPEFIKRFLDLMALYKFNVFHWHLIDDGGWRMASLRYPLLTERGAWRDTPKRGEWSQAALSFPQRRDGDEYGGYYTRQEIREIVAYAASLHITVVPEIELPGHTLPSIVCYPELACDPPGANQNVYCAGSERTFEFLEAILEETLDLFPSKYIHIGGDEVYKGWWANCRRCQARMERENLHSLDELQSYFIRRIDAFLSKKGRTLIGWDEILEGGLAPNASVMSWRGVQGESRPFDKAGMPSCVLPRTAISTTPMLLRRRRRSMSLIRCPTRSPPRQPT
jgi:hexosaminidase